MKQLLACVLVLCASAFGSSNVHGYYRKDGTYVHGYSRKTAPPGHAHAAYPAPSVRDSHGHAKRSRAAKSEFEHEHPCPATGKRSGSCPGYVVDHVKPLECGGADAPSNMQWQTLAAAKAKDKTEAKCRQ